MDLKKDSIIIPRIFGGLGNQLFCYAAARRLAVVNESELAIDNISGFVRDFTYQRTYMLDRFSIPCRLATRSERMEPCSRTRRFIAKKISQRQPFFRRSYVKQQGIDFDARLLGYKPSGKVYLDGYWQSEKYFGDIAPQIRDDLKITPPEDHLNRDFANVICQSNSVGLHVRFFDDPSTAGKNSTPADYYGHAISYMRSRVPDTHFYVFSDRPTEVLKRLPILGDNFSIVDHNKGDESAHLDLWLMSQCKHMIIANSTFSWWGAWLGNDVDRYVIAPGAKNQGGIMSWGFQGLLPERWIKM